MFVYYFTGNVIFGALLYMAACNIVDRPIYALINLKDDVRDAMNSVDYNIKEYIENFKSIDMVENVPDIDKAISNRNQSISLAMLEKNRLATLRKPIKAHDSLGNSYIEPEENSGLDPMLERATGVTMRSQTIRQTNNTGARQTGFNSNFGGLSRIEESKRSEN